MALTREEVLHVAQLAGLSLNPEEIETFTRQLNDVLAYVAKLHEVDSQGVPPLGHVVPLRNAFPEDEVRPGLAGGMTAWPTRPRGAKALLWCQG